MCSARRLREIVVRAVLVAWFLVDAWCCVPHLFWRGGSVYLDSNDGKDNQVLDRIRCESVWLLIPTWKLLVLVTANGEVAQFRSFDHYGTEIGYVWLDLF